MNNSKQIGNYLNQFYEFGPYVHKTDNNIPYKAAFFGAAFGDTRRLRLSMFDEIINQMRAKEETFYRDMDVKNIADFNNKYM